MRPTAARLHTVMAKGSVDTEMALRKPDESFTESEEERVLLLLETHFPERGKRKPQKY